MQDGAVYKSISDVAATLEVKPQVLRFWETQFIQIKPIKKVGGRRYYRAEDIELLRLIHDLLYKQGFTIKGAQKYLKALKKGQVEPSQENKEQAFLDEMKSIRDYLKNFLS